MTTSPEIELVAEISRAGKSLARSFSAIANAAAKAGEALKEFKVACYPNIPGEDHPIVKHLRTVAEAEGKVLKLVKYPRHIPDRVFGQSWIIFDELNHLDWHNRRVVKWRGKKMVYRDEIYLP